MGFTDLPARRIPLCLMPCRVTSPAFRRTSARQGSFLEDRLRRCFLACEAWCSMGVGFERLGPERLMVFAAVMGLGCASLVWSAQDPELTRWELRAIGMSVLLSGGFAFSLLLQGMKLCKGRPDEYRLNAIGFTVLLLGIAAIGVALAQPDDFLPLAAGLLASTLIALVASGPGELGPIKVNPGKPDSTDTDAGGKEEE